MFSLVDILRNSRCHPSRCILAVLALCLGKSLFFAKFVKCSAIFCYPTKTTQPHPRVSQFPSLNFLVISQYSFDIIFQISEQKVFQICSTQRAKKVVSDSPGLVDFAIGLVNFIFNLPNGQVMFFEQFE